MKTASRTRLLLIVALALLLALPVAAQDDMGDATVNIASTDMLDRYLVGADGMTLYIFFRDAPGVSNCVDQCAENWPPLTVDSEDALTVGDDIPGQVGVIEREDGSLQVTYNELPLYYWAADAGPGDTTGDGFANLWSIVEPVTVYVGGNDDLGRFLVGPEGMTLYLFTVDEPNASACFDQCIRSWPPLTVDSEDALTASRDLPGEFTVFEREDSGELQVAYNGWPLYYWFMDAEVGDAAGQGVNDVWYVIAPETVALGGTDELGEFLVDPRGYTLYLFTNDSANVSVCYDECANLWPPLLTAPGDELVAGEGVTGELGSFEREDGALQVTYNSWPLYYWINDQAPGDTTGHEFNDVWFVVPPDRAGP
jgi:predicted lipoprotein with Yx(FWY)xxD motif